LQKRKKVLLLHPQQRNALRNSDKKEESKGKKLQKKKIRKSLRELKKLFTFAPRKTRKVHWKIGRKIGEKEAKKKLQNFFKFFLRETKRSFSFAPALKHKRRKNKRHVRRHIELTAVLAEMLKQKK